MVICLAVKSLMASRQFYEAMGFQMTGGATEDGWAIMKRDGQELHLFEGHLNANCMNFRGGNVKSISEHLHSQGIEPTRGPEVESDGSVGLWIKDPDGNDIYFNTCPEEQSSR